MSSHQQRTSLFKTEPDGKSGITPKESKRIATADDFKGSRGLCKRLFGDKPYADLTADERRTYSQVWKIENKERVLAQIQKHRVDVNRRRRELFAIDPVVRAKRRAAEAEWRRTHPKRTAECYRKYRLKAEYGLTVEDYQRMYDEQGGVCAICGKKGTGNWYQNLAVDHDHETGKVRALLCHQCNLILGHLNEDANLMRRVIVYLEKHRARPRV